MTNYLDIGAVSNGPARYYRVRLVPQHEIYAHQTNEVVLVATLIKATTFYAAIPQAILEATPQALETAPLQGRILLGYRCTVGVGTK